jgi:membrane protease YdiL (CAAX protease family)
MVRSLGGHAGGNASSMTHDVEKRFDRPAAFRAAATYVLAVVAVAAVAFAVYAFAARESVVAASIVPAILFVGGLGAFLKTYREWKAQGGWAAWQGAGWFLLVLMLVCLSIPGAAIHAS